ncbi:MAG TPA: hypothetical protein VIG64_03110 [Actinomycetota bacterium]|jgi:hypothetical protein
MDLSRQGPALIVVGVVSLLATWALSRRLSRPPKARRDAGAPTEPDDDPSWLPTLYSLGAGLILIGIVVWATE